MYRRMPPPHGCDTNTIVRLPDSARRSRSTRRAKGRAGSRSSNSAFCAGYEGYSLASACSARAASSPASRGAERPVARVADEHVAGEQMPVARAARAQAEVDLDAEVAAERRAVERADRAQAIAPEVEARAGDLGHHGGRTRIRAREQRVERGHRLAGRQRIDRVRQRIRRRAHAVGERAHDTHARRGGVTGEAIEPVVGHLGIGLQHHGVAVAMQAERAVDGGGVALARRLVDAGSRGIARVRPADSARARVPASRR